MGFWSKHFQQAGQIDTLSRELEFEKRKVSELQSLLEREEWRVTALEKEVTKARNSEIRTLRHHADVISKNVKTQSSFAIIAKEDEPQPPPPLDEAMEQKIRYAAEMMNQMDIDDNVIPKEIEEYEAIIRQKPEQYIFY